MKFSDLLAFGLSALNRHRLRTFLTVLGVTIGTAALVASVSVGVGVRQIIDEQFKKSDDLRQITVYPSNDNYEDSDKGVPEAELNVEGDMSNEKRERIKAALAIRWKRQHTRPGPKPLTKERLDELRALPHVKDVVPELAEKGIAFLEETKRESSASIYGIPYQYQRIKDRVEVGRPFSAPNAGECLVSEYWLYRCGVRNDADVESIIGKPVRVQLTDSRRPALDLASLVAANPASFSQEEIDFLQKTWNMLPKFMESLPPKEKAILLKIIGKKDADAKEPDEKKISAVFTIAGVLRAPSKSENAENGAFDGPLRDADILIPSQAAEEFFLQLPSRRESGFSRARIVVDNEKNLEKVVENVKKLGLNEFSMGVLVRQARKNTLLIGFAMDFIALVALVVAVLGITNTMFTTVLERTSEIGILKAIGARDRQILLIFLIEGSLIGLAGGLLGVFFGWLSSFPGDHYALNILAKQDYKPLPTTVFLYPLWLLLSVPVFAVLMTTLAALLPARRAARVEPVVALRRE